MTTHCMVLLSALQLLISANQPEILCIYIDVHTMTLYTILVVPLCMYTVVVDLCFLYWIFKILSPPTLGPRDAGDRPKVEFSL